MRGVGRIGLVAISAVCMFALTSASAFAGTDQLLTKSGGVALRDMGTAAAGQPSAIELVAGEAIKLEVPGVATSECPEGEFGAFVSENKGVADPAEDPTLSVPFGAFENCTVTGGANAPVYVDTGGALPLSQITAVVNDDGAPNANNVVFKGLKLSLYIKEPATTCKFMGSGPAGMITGAWVNGTGPFTEEAAGNQTFVDFKGQELTGTCNGTAVKAKLTAAKFFVETTSDASNFTGNSDTVFFVEAVPAPSPEEGYGCSNPGAPKLQRACVGALIDSATGNLVEAQTDLSVGGRGPGLRVVRSYNGLAAAEATEPGPWGFGWTGPYSAHLVVNEGVGTAIVYQDNGSIVAFQSTGGKYAAGAWVQATLVKEGTTYVYTLSDQSKLEFNSEGRLTKETDRGGNSITLTYNVSHQLEKAADGDSRTFTFKYNGEGLVESVTDPLKHVVSYTYSSKQLASVTIEGKVRWAFEYEAPHLIKKITDGRAHSITNEYDGSHRVSKQTVAGHVRKWKYGATPGTETTLSEPNGSETLETFNAAGEATKVTRAKGIVGVEASTEYEYDGVTFNRRKLIDPNKHETKYGYDSEGNKTSETDPSKDEQKWTYDTKHNVETETTPEGETTTIKRDSHGEPEVIERPIGSETQKTEYKYNATEDLTEATEALKHATTYTYDAAGDRETETDPEKDERKWKYNGDSQETEETSPRGFTTKTERDEQGRPKKITDPLTHVTEYEYDGNSNVESETDGNKHTTNYEYNEENLRTKVEEPDKTPVETGYDAEGRMTSHKDGNGHTWKYERNQLEQVTEEKNPASRLTKKKYDKAGNLESLEDPEKHTTEYTYDESNRPKAVKYSTGKPSEVTYEYDKDGKVTKMKDETGETKNTYDKLDRITEAKNGAGKIVKYKYNLVNEPTAITYPNEKEVTRGYDKDNRLEKVTDWNTKETTFKYNADSQPTTTTFPGTVDKDEYAYNEADQMSEVKMLKGATELGKLVYERDNDGQVKKTTTTVLPGPASSEDKYDENNRLTEDNKEPYEYDKANNPTKIEAKGPYTYKGADELEKGPEATYAYNEDGRRTETKPTKGPTETYGYDQPGNLTTVKRPKEGETSEINDSYTYDGTNLRQTQTINGAKTNLTWDTAEPLPLVLADETNSYIYGPENLPIEQISSTTTLYLHHDQQGSTRLLTNATGEKETAYTYNPYGKLNATTGTTTTPLRYDAQYTNTDTGLIYLRARTYDPATAQFLSVDPALEATGEPYAYADDNPLNQADPTGECQRTECDELRNAEAIAYNDLRSAGTDQVTLWIWADQAQANADQYWSWGPNRSIRAAFIRERQRYEQAIRDAMARSDRARERLRSARRRRQVLRCQLPDGAPLFSDSDLGVAS